MVIAMLRYTLVLVCIGFAKERF